MMVSLLHLLGKTLLRKEHRTFTALTSSEENSEEGRNARTSSVSLSTVQYILYCIQWCLMKIKMIKHFSVQSQLIIMILCIQQVVAIQELNQS